LTKQDEAEMQNRINTLYTRYYKPKYSLWTRFLMGLRGSVSLNTRWIGIMIKWQVCNFAETGPAYFFLFLTIEGKPYEYATTYEYTWVSKKPTYRVKLITDRPQFLANHTVTPLQRNVK